MRRIACVGACVGLLAGCSDDPAARPDVGDVGVADSADAEVGIDAQPTDAGLDVWPDTPDASDATDEPDASGPWEFATTPELLAQAGQEWTYAPLTEPPLSDIRIAVGPDGATIIDGVLQWIPPEREVSEAEFTLDAWAGDDTVATQTFTLDVNHPPEFLNSPPANATVGEMWVFVPIANDEDSDSIAWSLESAPDWMSIDEEAVVGSPVAAGETAFVLVADDGRGGVSRLEASLTIIEVLRDLSASTHHLGNLDAELSLFGCCFDSTPDVYWGGVPLGAERINAGRLDLAFRDPPRPGDQAIQILLEDVIIGELPLPVTLLPEPTEIEGSASVFGELSDSSIRLLGWDGTLIESAELAADATSWSTDARGVFFVEVDGVGSEPFMVEGGGELVVFDAAPRIHEPGDAVEFTLSATTDARLTAEWGERRTTCFPVGGTSCLATVPGGASGFVTLAADGDPLPSVTSAVAGSPAGLLHGPWIDWASRRTISPGVPTIVVLSTLGGTPTSPDAELELVELTESRAVVRVLGDEPVATIRVRSDEWVLAVE